MKLTDTRYFLAITALTIMTFPLSANTVLPGGSVSPDVFTITSTPPLLGDLTGTFNIGSGKLTGSWEEAVLVDPLGVTCTGCLDFAFQINLNANSLDNIFALGLASFFGYSTDAGYVSNSGDVATDSVLRGPLGGPVFFLFTDPVLTPGHSTDFLVVATNAKTYDQHGSIGVYGGNSDVHVNGSIQRVFEPTAVPEPSTIALMSLGLLGIAAFRKKLS